MSKRGRSMCRAHPQQSHPLYTTPQQYTQPKFTFERMQVVSAYTLGETRGFGRAAEGIRILGLAL